MNSVILYFVWTDLLLHSQFPESLFWLGSLLSCWDFHWVLREGKMPVLWLVWWKGPGWFDVGNDNPSLAHTRGGPLLHRAMSAVSVGFSLASAGKMLCYAKVVVDVELEEFLTGCWDSLPPVCCVFMVLMDFFAFINGWSLASIPVQLRLCQLYIFFVQQR